MEEKELKGNKQIKLNSKLIIGIIILIIVFLIIFFTIIFPKTKNNNVSKKTLQIPILNSTEQVNTNDQKQDSKTEEKIPYTISSYSLTAVPTYDDLSGDTVGVFKVNPQIWYMASFQINYDTINEEEAPESLKLVETKFITEPKIGKYNIIATTDGDMSNREEFINKYSFKNGEYTYNTDLFGSKLENGNFYLSLGLWIYDTKEYTYPTETSSILSSEVITDSGIKSDDVRAKISTQIEIKTKIGNTYYMPLEIELLNGNFLENNQLIMEKHFDSNNNIDFFKK